MCFLDYACLCNTSLFADLSKCFYCYLANVAVGVAEEPTACRGYASTWPTVIDQHMPVMFTSSFSSIRTLAFGTATSRWARSRYSGVVLNENVLFRRVPVLRRVACSNKRVTRKNKYYSTIQEVAYFFISRWARSRYSGVVLNENDLFRRVPVL